MPLQDTQQFAEEKILDEIIFKWSNAGTGPLKEDEFVKFMKSCYGEIYAGDIKVEDDDQKAQEPLVAKLFFEKVLGATEHDFSEVEGEEGVKLGIDKECLRKFINMEDDDIIKLNE